MYKLVSVNKWKRWRNFIVHSVKDYFELACKVPPPDLEVSSAHVILPSDRNVPSMLRRMLDDQLFDPPDRRARGWRLVENADQEAFEYLKFLSQNTHKPWLICFSEYSSPSDPILGKTQHIVFNGNVFQILNLQSATIETFTRVVGSSRSQFLYAILSEVPENPARLSGGGVFCLGVFDGTAIIVCRLERPPRLE